MKYKFKTLYMDIASRVAAMSYAKKRQVGCAIVLDGVVFTGYNGTPSGAANVCETPDGLTTLPNVIHAEQNALDKITRSTMSSVGAFVFVTTAPCIECARRLLGAKVAYVAFRDLYKNSEGVELLKENNIPCERIDYDTCKEYTCRD